MGRDKERGATFSASTGSVSLEKTVEEDFVEKLKRQRETHE